MDSLAANNFNVVYVNAWSRGYPLWQSEYFYNETGIKIDPSYIGRDILAEAIAEGHKHGLHVEAWFEYGFVGGYELYYPGTSGKGKIFDVHPEWVAKRLDGGEKDNSNFYWMVHTRKDVQDFLVALVMEVVRKYDIDGIELDRIRYSSLQYGYDAYTDSLYRSEHNGVSPPTNFSDPNWIRWRADKLNEFQARIYDSVKSVNPKFNLSNAPSLYSSSSYTSYNSFCQDWVWWVNNNKIDNVQVQSYVSSLSTFSNILDYTQTLVANKSKVFPAFAVAPNGSPIPINDVYQFIDITRAKGFKGNSIWYYTDLITYFSALKEARYGEKTFPPYSSSNWREFKKIISISNLTDAVRYENWTSSLIYGYDGPSIYANSGDSASIKYYVDVPANGYYEVYAFIVTASDRSQNTEYIVIDSAGTESYIYIDQSSVNNKRWYKLGDYYLQSGRNLVVIVSNRGTVSGKRVSADAVMIKLNRKLSPDVVTKVKENDRLKQNDGQGFNLKNFPNPFNNQTTVYFRSRESKKYDLRIYNLLGKLVYSIENEVGKLGDNYLQIDTTSLPSGIYLCSLYQGEKRSSIKLLLLK